MEHIQRIVCGNVNCYLISNGKAAILVDTGRKQHCQTVLDACKSFQVQLIVLTHGHMDHAQNAAFLSQAFKCPVAMHKDDLPLLADNMNQPLSADSILGKVVLSITLKNFKTDEILPFTPTVFLDDGDILSSYGISASVISLPGHTNGSIGLDVSGQGLIEGDALMNMFYPTVSMLYYDRKTMLQSVEKVERMGMRTIYFGHGKPTKNRKWLK